jgi:hypothetical protein
VMKRNVEHGCKVGQWSAMNHAYPVVTQNVIFPVTV